MPTVRKVKRNEEEIKKPLIIPECNDEKNQMVTIRVPKEVLEALDKTCPKGGRTEKLRSMMEKEASTSQGEQARSFDLEAKIAEKSQLLKKEWEQQSFLEKTLLRDRFSNRQKTAWELMNRFFWSLADKKQSEKFRLSIADYKDLREKMLHFKLSGDEAFSNSERLSFIHLLDYKIRRLTLEKAIEAYLQKQATDEEEPKTSEHDQPAEKAESIKRRG